ncbi:MAG: hypothetical protein LIP28_09795, partial [Deltaproteobacteria bacterium]|nr:hypothetical protein [Deltaproteobacteria bacterium]
FWPVYLAAPEPLAVGGEHPVMKLGWDLTQVHVDQIEDEPCGSPCRASSRGAGDVHTKQMMAIAPGYGDGSFFAQLGFRPDYNLSGG